MDLFLERQAVEKMKGGDIRQFLVLFDANFDDVYKYVYRRVADVVEAERITRLTFLDALSKIQEAPLDVSTLIWLYQLGKERAWALMAHSSYAQGKTKGFFIVGEALEAGDREFVHRAEKMFGKLSLEEREIIRLKFLEELTDGDVMTVLGLSETEVGPRIYRVLKRTHFLLFGDSDERQGVYFGELSGFLTRMRDLEEVEVPEPFRLSLRVDLEGRIERRDFAIDGELLKEEVVRDFAAEGPQPMGSNDPAKIFVNAVREMREEEAAAIHAELEKKERAADFFDRWKLALGLIPATLVVVLVAIFLLNFMGSPKAVHRGFVSTCDIEVSFEGNFSDGEKQNVNKGVSDRLCDYYDVQRLLITRADDGVVDVEVDVPDWMLEYRFVRKPSDWRIKKYARTLTSNGKSGEV